MGILIVSTSQVCFKHLKRGSVQNAQSKHSVSIRCYGYDCFRYWRKGSKQNKHSSYPHGVAVLAGEINTFQK